MAGDWEILAVQPAAAEDGETFTFYTNSLPAGDSELYIKLDIE